MPTLSFDGETHDEIVRKVKRWLASVEGQDEHLDLPEAVERATELTKDALTVIAQAAPAPIARSEVVKSLTRMGYEATDSTKRAVIAGLDALSDATEGDVVRRVEKARNSVLYEMNAAVARQLLRSLRPRG
jgi:methionyl-tRNA synthetase